SLMYRLGVAYSHDPERKRDGEELKTFAPILVLGDLTAATKLAEAVREFDSVSAGDTWYANFVSRFGRMRGRLGIEREAAEKKGDFAEALAVQRQMMFAPQQGRETPYYL